MPLNLINAASLIAKTLGRILSAQLLYQTGRILADRPREIDPVYALEIKENRLALLATVADQENKVTLKIIL